MSPSSATVHTQASGSRLAAMEGVLLGTAVGDALGLPAENLSPGRIQRWWHGQWQMRLLFGRGMISDDTEHTLLVAQALLTQPSDAAAFQRCLGWKLRWWFAALPGGMGLATAKACLRLWMGFPLHRCAVRSAGSGPAMRSAILGVFFAHDTVQRHAFVLASSRLTHRGWQAETAALAVADVTACLVNHGVEFSVESILDALGDLSGEPEWLEGLHHLRAAHQEGDSVAKLVSRLNLHRGVTGYSLHVASVAIYAVLHHRQDFRNALTSVLDCGGDTDTVGAVVGAMCGALGGKAVIPIQWLDTLADWPRSKAFMSRVALKLDEQLQSQNPLGAVPWFWPAAVPSNLMFLAVIITHGFRRLLPPY